MIRSEIFGGAIISTVMASNFSSDVTGIGAVVIICTTVGMALIKIVDKLISNLIEKTRNGNTKKLESPGDLVARIDTLDRKVDELNFKVDQLTKE